MFTVIILPNMQWFTKDETHSHSIPDRECIIFVQWCISLYHAYFAK